MIFMAGRDFELEQVIVHEVDREWDVAKLSEVPIRLEKADTFSRYLGTLLRKADDDRKTREASFLTEEAEMPGLIDDCFATDLVQASHRLASRLQSAMKSVGRVKRGTLLVVRFGFPGEGSWKSGLALLKADLAPAFPLHSYEDAQQRRVIEVETAEESLPSPDDHDSLQKAVLVVRAADGRQAIYLVDRQQSRPDRGIADFFAKTFAGLRYQLTDAEQTQAAAKMVLKSLNGKLGGLEGRRQYFQFIGRWAEAAERKEEVDLVAQAQSLPLEPEIREAVVADFRSSPLPTIFVPEKSALGKLQSTTIYKDNRGLRVEFPTDRLEEILIGQPPDEGEQNVEIRLRFDRFHSEVKSR